jgi:hypothetical protein
MDILNVVTSRVIGELVYALQEAARRLSDSSAASEAAELASLVRKGCSDHSQANAAESYCLIKFALDTQEYWHQTQTDKSKQSEAEVRIKWVQTDEQGQT